MDATAAAAAVSHRRFIDAYGDAAHIGDPGHELLGCPLPCDGERGLIGFDAVTWAAYFSQR